MWIHIQYRNPLTFSLDESSHHWGAWVQNNNNSVTWSFACQSGISNSSHFAGLSFRSTRSVFSVAEDCDLQAPAMVLSHSLTGGTSLAVAAVSATLKNKMLCMLQFVQPLGLLDQHRPLLFREESNVAVLFYSYLQELHCFPKSYLSWMH